MPDQIRRKTVTIDGAEFIISPLTLKRTRELAKEDTETISVIAYSLNRAAGSDDTEYTKENLEDLLDAHSRTVLFNEILAFSGLRQEGGATGESKA